MENKDDLICEIGILGGNDKERNIIYFVSFVHYEYIWLVLR